ncbi:unnamed protein product [Cyprideis torosa]|uniref:Sulfhydryl oxidase n=1 Tax=Cyprideis torosa TaxID=163714 RepID=A0A7R8ZKQ1_9CRUS|nr:unnamed protein product [Cyprideis torosa]CAG0884918.1 unnamed protein product [Cyprideis torosa]
MPFARNRRRNYLDEEDGYERIADSFWKTISAASYGHPHQTSMKGDQETQHVHVDVIEKSPPDPPSTDGGASALAVDDDDELVALVANWGSGEEEVLVPRGAGKVSKKEAKVKGDAGKGSKAKASLTCEEDSHPDKHQRGKLNADGATSSASEGTRGRLLSSSNDSMSKTRIFRCYEDKLSPSIRDLKTEFMESTTNRSTERGNRFNETVMVLRSSPPSRVNDPMGGCPPGYRDCPLDINELGKATWSFLHTMAAYYPDTPTAQQQKDMCSFIRTFGQFYPCHICANHFRKMCETHPPVVTSRTNLSQWFCERHNDVNKRLGKPQFDCKLVDERWLDGWSDGSCD